MNEPTTAQLADELYWLRERGDNLQASERRRHDWLVKELAHRQEAEGIEHVRALRLDWERRNPDGDHDMEVDL